MSHRNAADNTLGSCWIVSREFQSPFFLKELPSVRRAWPPVGWHRTAEQLPHNTTVWEWLNTVVMLKHPWHLTSMKKELGDWTRRFNLCFFFSSSAGGCSKSMSLERTWDNASTQLMHLEETYTRDQTSKLRPRKRLIIQIDRKRCREATRQPMSGGWVLQITSPLELFASLPRVHH